MHPTRLLALSALAQCFVLAGPPEFDSAIDAIAPGTKKWATVCVVTQEENGAPKFAWTDYADTGNATEFWPASAIKIYAVIAALELLNERDFPLDTIATFEHRD